MEQPRSWALTLSNTRGLRVGRQVGPIRQDSGLRVSGFHKIDFSDEVSIEDFVARSDYDTVVNFAAKTDVNAVERERGDQSPGSSAWALNVLAPEAMARGAARTRKLFATISSDFVFDGRDGPYSETSAPVSSPSAVSWYGWTKAQAESRVLNVNPDSLIIRISYPYRARYAAKSDFGRRMVEWQRRGDFPPLFSDQILTPTWIPDVTSVLRLLLARTTLRGLPRCFS